MAVTRRGLGLRVAEEGTDDRERIAGGCRHARMRVAQVVEPDIPKLGLVANAPPHLHQVDDWLPWILTAADVGIPLDPFQILQYLQGGFAE